MLISDIPPDGTTSSAGLTRPGERARNQSIALFTSLAAHFLLLALYITASKNSPQIEEQAGKQGGAMSVFFFAPAPVDVSEPLTSGSEIPASLVSPGTVVVDNADIAMERHTTSALPKPIKKAAPAEAKPKARPPVETVKRAAKTVSAPAPARQSKTAETSREVSQPVASAAGGAASVPGESTAGNAARGAGNATSNHFRILNRRVNYPARARSMGVEGQVKAQFDISASGTIKNIRILAENPPGVFGADLKRDISRWRYDTNGEIKDQVVTVIFKIDGRIQLVN